MRIFNRTLSVVVCRPVLFAVIALSCCLSQAQAQWSTNGNDISNSNSGNIGVKTTTPEFPLQVNSTSTNVLGAVYTGSMSSTGGAGFQLLTSTAASAFGQRLGFLSFGTRNAGISYNSVVIQGFSSQAWTPGSAQGSYLTFSTTPTGTTAVSERLRIDQNGYVGIGTNSPADLLHISNNTTNSVGTIRLQGGNNTAGFIGQWDVMPMLLLSNNRHPGLATNYKTNSAGSMILIGAESNPGDIAFYSTSSGTTPTYTDLVRMKANGRVGIGTITPGYQLDVQGGSINSSGGLCIAGDCKTAWSQVGGGTSQWTTSGTTINYSTGNVGIGVASPGTKLDVNGAVNATSFTIGGTAITSSQWSSSGSTINYSGGNVGINNSTPLAKLHVTGVGPSGTALFAGTNNWSHFNYNADSSEDTYIRGGKTTSRVIINDAASGGVLLAGGGGNVGVGTSSPTSKLHVAGSGRFTGDLTVDGNIAAKYQDVAEWVPAVEAEELSAGTVVVLDRTKPNHVIFSSKSYDSRVAGVISAQPGIVLGEKADNKVLVATTGRVLVNVDASSGPIEIGDLLVTSDREGVAMKSQPVEIGGVRIHRPGTLIGKALEPLASGTGKILVLLSLQ